MTTLKFARLLLPCAAALLAACTASPPRGASPEAVESVLQNVRIESFRVQDDLLTAGLGLDGLRNTTPPAFADPAHPTRDELRRRAIWNNWRGIADLAPGGGYGELYGSLAAVPGTEFHAFMTVPGAKQPHRVMLQLPDAYDASKRCLLVTASSGSRGIYGAIALAGAWGLPRGCAVVYTDKGAGTDYVDLQDADAARALDGTIASTDTGSAFDLRDQADAAPRIAYKHAHSQDNPEADWGRHVKQAAEFGLHALSQARPGDEPYTFANTTVIAAGLSNGGGAVLRAAEIEGDWLDGAVVAAPNVLPPDGGRALYDYVTEAAIYMPCALLDASFDNVAFARPGGAKAPAALQRCASLRAAALLEGDTLEAQAADARARLHANGWTDEAIEAGAISVTFDLWRAVAVGYAAAYTRSPAASMPCGFSYAALDAQGKPRAVTPEERAAWWSDAAGIPPGAGVGIVDTMMQGDDPTLPGLRCLRDLWQAQTPLAAKLREGVAATRARMPRDGLPVIVIHGADDGLVPEAFSGGAYAKAASDAGADVRYWRIANAQHFDAFLGLPPLAVRYVPLLPYAYRALDAMLAHVSEGAPLPASVDVVTTRRTASASGIEPLAAKHLAIP
jgi:hydroxybutyrate-dimer hydrolase